MEQRMNQRHTGQGVIEYALILALLAAVAVLALSAMGVSLQNVLSEVVAALGGLGAEQPPSCEVFYQSQFDRGINEWYQLKRGLWRGRWRNIHGRMVGDPLSAALLKSVNRDDYVVTAESIELKKIRDSYQGFALIFRAPALADDLEGYMFEFEKKNAADPGLMYFSKWVRGYQVFPPLASVAVPADFDWDRVQQMRITVQDDRFTALINGREVLRVRDATYSQGYVGMAVNYGSEASVGNFSVASLGCP
jgi:Flp pilus assembly pilin Flp